MKIANIASRKARAKGLKTTIAAVAPQVDKLFVYLNDYNAVPKWFEEYENVIPILASWAIGDIRDLGKFYMLRVIDYPCLYLTVDDDILYPPDYVEVLTSQIIAKSEAVSFHAFNPKPFMGDFFTDREYPVHFSEGYKQASRAYQVLGTGCLGFHVPSEAETAVSCTLPFSGLPADIWFAKYMRLHGLQGYVAEREEGYLKPNPDIDQEDSIYRRQKRDKYHRRFLSELL